MKHLILTLAIALMGTFGLCAAETTDPLAYLKRLDAFLSTGTVEEQLEQVTSTQANVIASKVGDTKARWAITKTILETANDTTSTFAQMVEKANKNYTLAGVNLKSWEAASYLTLLIDAKYVKNLPESRVNEGIEYLKQYTGAQSRLGRVLEQLGRTDEAIAVYKKSTFWECIDRYMYLATKKNRVEAYEQWIAWGVAGKLPPKTAKEYVNTVVNYYLVDENTDKAAFKKKLEIMTIVYSNKMTNEQRQKEWNTFVAILKNTISLL